ncbi:MULTISPECIES: AAA family ATPase [Bacillus cereus group]|uniref:AAA family ATPase n=1 Tax=Bacillus cereus group TaxID=86661 RepID=UPI0011A95561|nr:MULTISPECIES: AAA family ATPase [Bacillus cereus group]WAI29784.1 MAG: AAA family ATPase [Bacillus paranthracis]MDA2666866.1 AAA family ATPase [Bacillus cereus group sp. Bc032]MDA2677569.1 AAA family ATPase [Bacillus cereus group sp. Bc031]MDA2683074.1 AAA family ATPase [Bacillus cereus group sp. Bc029]MDA2744040.1 AAA family ATPase [Bacillus cereus group sp. Bc011]
MFFVQMSGFPGSGKSTLARKIAKGTGAVIIDHDIVKTALLLSIEEAPIDVKLAGKISYNIDWSLIEFHLSEGQAVIFDSPCLYEEMVEKGTDLSKKYNVKYKYIECYLDDSNEINFRLKKRDRMLSQIKEIQSEESFKYTIKNSKKPSEHKCLVVDTKQPLESYILEVMNYIHE